MSVSIKIWDMKIINYVKSTTKYKIYVLTYKYQGVMRDFAQASGVHINFTLYFKVNFSRIV